MVILAFDQLCRDSIVVYDDDEVEGRFLSLDELGAVLRRLSETLPGIYMYNITDYFKNQSKS